MSPPAGLATGFPDVVSVQNWTGLISNESGGAPPTRSAVETSNFPTSRPPASLATGFPDVASVQNWAGLISNESDGAPPARSAVETSNFPTSRPPASHATGFRDVGPHERASIVHADEKKRGV